MAETKFTKSQFAERHNMRPEHAYQLLAYLQSVKMIDNVGNAPRAPGAKGRGEAIYKGDTDRIVAHLRGLNFEFA